jgi:hypothetical protein
MQWEMKNIDSIKNIKDLFDKKFIRLCIEQIQSDFNKYPIFYNPNIVPKLHSEELIEIVLDKLNNEYSPDVGDSFRIPYDFISERDSISIQIEDLVIRYLLMSVLQKSTGYEITKVEEDEKKISEYILACNADSQNIFKIDIYNYYESIDHQIFISKICGLLKIDISNPFVQLLSKHLTVMVRDSNNNIHQKKNGLCIGLKTDEYFADIFMWLIINELNQTLNKKVFHIADEIIFSSSNLSESRDIVNKVESLLRRYRLQINKSKNKPISLSFPELEKRKKLILRDMVNDTKGDSYFKSWANERGGWYQYELQDSGYIKKEENIDQHLIVMNEKGETITKREEEIYNIEINSYTDSIKFIRLLIEDIQHISQYQKKHPQYKYFHNIVFSQPKDFVLDYKNLKLYAFDPFILRQLLTIIYQFPRSEYYSSMALEILVFVAKNTSYNAFYCYDKEKFHLLGISHLVSKLSEICELSNVGIIELLRSNNIHEYQKYLLIRSLYKNANDLNFSLKNYKNNLILYDDDPWFKANPDLPFPGLVYDEIKRLSKASKNFALTTLCNHIMSL